MEDLTMSTIREPHECPVCHKVFFSTYVFERHLILKHKWPVAKAQQFAGAVRS
jgi:hypothetical protein